MTKPGSATLEYSVAISQPWPSAPDGGEAYSGGHDRPRVRTMKRQEAVMTAGVRRVVPLTFGWENLPETVSIHGGDPTRRLREPVPGVLLELDGGWMLLDTGFNIPLV